MYAYNNKHSLRSNTIAIILHLVAGCCTIWISRSRRSVRKVLVTSSYTNLKIIKIYINTKTIIKINKKIRH